MYAREREECDSETRCALSHAVIHLLVHCKRRHTKAHAQTCTHKHLRAVHTHTSCFPGGHGASGTELESLVRLFRSNYRNRTISATAAPAFLYSYKRERGRERENKALTAFSHNGERLSHPLSTVTVCRLSVQHNRRGRGKGRGRGRGRVSCVISPLILM